MHPLNINYLSFEGSAISETLINAMNVRENALPVGRVAHLQHVLDVQKRHDSGFFSICLLINLKQIKDKF